MSHRKIVLKVGGGSSFMRYINYVVCGPVILFSRICVF